MIRAEFRGVFTGLSVVAAIVLVAISVDFGIPGQDVLSSIRFHLVFAMLALPVMLVLSGARLRALVMTALVLGSLGQGAAIVWQQQQARLALIDRPVLGRFTLLSFNVLSTNPTGQAAARMMADSGADVAVVLEAPGVLPYLDLLQNTYPYRAGCDTGLICDSMLLSRTPLTDVAIRPLGELGRVRLITAHTVIDGQGVTLMTVHLSKPYFDGVALGELWQIWFALRAIEGPLVVAGDFNAAAWSRPVVNISRDAGLIPPPRYPATWPVELGDFGVPIDNIFTRGGALIDDIVATPPTGSNHRGLLAQISIRTPSAQ